jgi:spore coat polysaccharide biosynthesis protein SpsF
MKIGAIIQARTGSSRLPGKVLLELPYGSGITTLEQVIRRVKKSRKVEDVIVATTTKSEDDKIVRIAEKEGVKTFRGSEKDVLSRYYHAAKEHNLDIVVRITSDCPCIDPNVIDLVVEHHLKTNADYTRNEGYPRGFDVEVISFKALEEAYRCATQPFEREHVCPYIYTTAPEKFKIEYVPAPREFYRPDIRVTLDTEEDYALLCCVFDNLYGKNPFFGVSEVVELFNKKPYLEIINKKIRQKRTFLTLEEELKEAIKVLELQELNRAKKLLEEHLK